MANYWWWPDRIRITGMVEETPNWRNVIEIKISIHKSYKASFNLLLSWYIHKMIAKLAVSLDHLLFGNSWLIEFEKNPRKASITSG